MEKTQELVAEFIKLITKLDQLILNIIYSPNIEEEYRRQLIADYADIWRTSNIEDNES